MWWAYSTHNKVGDGSIYSSSGNQKQPGNRGKIDLRYIDTDEEGMADEECRMLAELGSVIGRYEAEKQRELIDRTAEYFERRARFADEEKRRQYKLRAALGIGSGLMLAILMI